MGRRFGYRTPEAAYFFLLCRMRDPGGVLWAIVALGSGLRKKTCGLIRNEEERRVYEDGIVNASAIAIKRGKT